MMKDDRPAVLVLGSNEIGSAIAVALHRGGYAVVLIDEADPAWHRRGMCFADAWYVGTTELDGETAQFCANFRSIPTIFERHRAIAATTWSWRGVTEALRPVAIVDARLRPSGPSSLLVDLDGARPLAVGVGPRFVIGRHADIAVETAAGQEFGRIVTMGATSDDEPWPAELRGPQRERFFCSTTSGRFFTTRRIGDAVTAGEVVGSLGCDRVRAPASGVLRGLSAPGARVPVSSPLVEVDPHGGSKRCFGIEDGARKLGTSVVEILAGGRLAPTKRSRDLVRPT